MKYVIPAAFALSLVAGGLAQAQTTAPNANGTNPPTTVSPSSPAVTNPSATNPASTNRSTTGALGVPGTNNPNSNAAVATTGNGGSNSTHLASGANSFTQGEARSRIQSKGFSQVNNLKLDNQGIWRGTATKDGKSVQVALDYQGNVVAQ